MVELKDFISETIKQIVMGLETASKECENYDVIINPNITVGSCGNYYIPTDLKCYHMQRRIQSLDMEIGVSVDESSNINGTGKIGIPVICIKAEGGNSQCIKNENKIRFSIPICLPTKKID